MKNATRLCFALLLLCAAALWGAPRAKDCSIGLDVPGQGCCYCDFVLNEIDCICPTGDECIWWTNGWNCGPENQDPFWGVRSGKGRLGSGQHSHQAVPPQQ